MNCNFVLLMCGGNITISAFGVYGGNLSISESEEHVPVHT